MTRMHQTGITMALVALMPPAVGSAQEPVAMARRTTADVVVRLTGPIARLEVRAWSHDSVALSGTLPRTARLDGGFTHAADGASRIVKWFISDSGTTGGALRLDIPARARLILTLGEADVTVRGAVGELDLTQLAGTLRITGAPRIATVDAFDATVTLDGAPTTARIKTSAGAITLTGSSTDLTLATVSGAVTVTGRRHERVAMESISGAVTFAGDVRRGGYLTLSSHSGPVVLRVPARTAMDVDAATHAATIVNTLTPQRPLATRGGGQELGLLLGTGDATVQIRTFKAPIRIAPLTP